MWNDQILGILPSILLADTIQIQYINYYTSNENKQIHVKLHLRKANQLTQSQIKWQC